MYQYLKQLSKVTQRSIVPRASARCLSQSNSPSYTPLLDIVKERQLQARRSVLVQVAGPNSALDLASYCHEQFGEVDSLHYYNNKSSKNFNHFFIVNFRDSDTVTKILEGSTHSVSDGAAASPVPVYSPFLWLQGGKTSKNIKKYHHIRVDYGQTDLTEQKVRNMSDVSEQMYHLWKVSNMTDTSLRLRFLVCRQLELAISGMFPHAEVLPFGSAINGFGTCSSDQDMVLDLDMPRTGRDSRLVFQAKGAVFGGDRAQVQRYCEEIASIIQSFLPGCQDVQKILNARVPLIKYTQELAGLDCDLSMSSSSGLHMSCLLHLWGDTDWRVRPLVATVRRWARSLQLVKEMRPTQYFTNFTLTMLVICYLQSLGMLPAFSTLIDRATEEDAFLCRDGVNATFLHNISNQKEILNQCYQSKDTLVELLHGFFSFYAIYDFNTQLLCPITGTSKMKTKRWANSSHLDIINPLEPSLNVSYNVNGKAIESFKDRCRESIRKLNDIKKSRSDGEPLNDGLFWLFESSEKKRNERPKLTIPNLHDFDLGPRKVKQTENNGPDLSKNIVSTLFEEEESQDLQPIPNDQSQEVLKVDAEDKKLKNDQKLSGSDTFSPSPSQSPEPEDQFKPRRSLKYLFEKEDVKVKDGKMKMVKQLIDISDEEDRRIEKLKSKYLRGNTSHKFKHKL